MNQLNLIIKGLHILQKFYLDRNCSSQSTFSADRNQASQAFIVYPLQLQATFAAQNLRAAPSAILFILELRFIEAEE
jgi:hypothetical protein